MIRIAAAIAALLFGFSVSAQDFTLRAGHDQPVGSMYDEGHQMFKKLVEERSKGRIRVGDGHSLAKRCRCDGDVRHQSRSR